MDIQYKINHKITTQQFLDVLTGSNLGSRRPIDDLQCIQGMLENSNLLVTAWDQSKLVGVARSVTDFNYVCYLSDLAVLNTHQNRRIGKQLQTLTQRQLGPKCKLILVAAPAANTYYEKIGFTHNPRCWVLERDSDIVN